jgi:hypothetical protein
MNAKCATKICTTGTETAWETTETRTYHIEEGRKAETEGRLAETQEIPGAEDLTDRSIRLVKGISFETLVFDPQGSSVRNASGLEVVSEPPEPYVLDKFYSLAEHSQVASRIDPTSKILGIQYPQFVDQGRRGLVWC